MQGEVIRDPTSFETLGFRLILLNRYLRRNKTLGFGLGILIALVILWIIGSIITDSRQAQPFSATAPSLPPSSEYWLGSDLQGREMLAVMVEGFPLTLAVGLVGGIVGTVLGTMFAFASGYYAGVTDNILRGIVDTLQTVPALLVVIIVAVTLPGTISVWQMAFVISALAWLTPARTIRSQVLVLKEKPFVEMARLSGMNGPSIIIQEMIPNMMPFIFASFVLAVGTAILVSVGVEALGLGPFEANTIGMTIYRATQAQALQNSWWWWIVPPVALIVVLFVALFLIALGLDEWSNPRLRRRV